MKRTWARCWLDFKDRLLHGTTQQVIKKASAPKPKKALSTTPHPAVTDTKGLPPLSNAVRAGMTRLLQQMKDLEEDLSTGELVRKVLDIGWEYLTLVDEKKTFAQPVSG